MFENRDTNTYIESLSAVASPSLVVVACVNWWVHQFIRKHYKFTQMFNYNIHLEMSCQVLL